MPFTPTQTTNSQHHYRHHHNTSPPPPRHRCGQDELNAYYHEYQNLLKHLLLLVRHDTTTSNTSKHRQQQQQQQRQLASECHELLQLMMLEARGMSTGENDDDLDWKLEWLERIKLYQSQLQQVQQDESIFIIPSSQSSSSLSSSSLSLSLPSTATEQQRQPHTRQPAAAPRPSFSEETPSWAVTLSSVNRERTELFGSVGNGTQLSPQRQATTAAPAPPAHAALHPLSRDHYETTSMLQQQRQQQETLERARRTMQETEAIAVGIGGHLYENRTKLESAHQNIRQMGLLTNQANGLIQSMSKPWYRPW